MYPQENYRLGDFARSTMPDGEYVALIKAFDPAQGKDQQPQIKVTAALLGPHAGKTHTWWYTCTKDACFRLFDDLIALGVDPNYQAGPPVDQAGNNHWAALFGPSLIGKGVNIVIKTRNDFTNTLMVSFAELGPNGQPLALTHPVQHGSAQSSDPFAPPAAPYVAAGSSATVDVGGATDLFRRG